MEQKNGCFENAKTNIAVGLIYCVKHQKFDKVYKDSTTGRIRIECSGEADQEAGTSVSAA